jgi:tetratricopeptide (TPR) repeat protein
MPLLTKPAPAMVRCTRCGAEFLSKADTCPKCGRAAGWQSSRVTLTVTVLLVFAGFGFTQYFVNLHRATEFSLANRWSSRGQQAMQAGLPAVAADDYRTALSYDPENRGYRLHLAQALLAANRLNEARAHLISLWEQEPADGDVNLTLARLYAKRGDLANATRYYSNAINGIWGDDTRQQRVAVRFELSNYLMQQHKLTQAQSELMALLADAPSDPAGQLRLGQLLLQVNEPEHTLEIDNAVLVKDHANADAYIQKAQALLSQKKFVDAERALASAVEYDPKSVDARRQLELIREVLRFDTSLVGLSRSGRADRAMSAFQSALQRLNNCASQLGVTFAKSDGTAPGSSTTASPSSPLTTSPAAAPDVLQQLYDSGVRRQAGVTEKNLQEDSDALESTMQYVFEVERATAPVCSQMNLTDQALLMLAQCETEAQK